MRLTRASSYAMHAITFLVERGPNQSPIPSHEIARVRKIPERFLLKVLKPLVAAGILSSIKGPNGGYRLLKPANKITWLEVIEAVDGPIRADIMDWEGSTTSISKRMQTVYSATVDTVRRAFSKATASDLVETGRGR